MTTVEILTSDAAWAAKHGTPGRNGRTAIKVADVERVRFARVDMIRFDMQAVAKRLPSDWLNRWTMIPAAHEVV